MEKTDLLKPVDEVSVNIFGPDGSSLYKSTNSGFHTLEMAVENAIANSNLAVSPEDCVFEISNLTTGVSHRYRLNAHGHLKLIL